MPDTATTDPTDTDRTVLKAAIRKARRAKISADHAAEVARRNLYRLCAEANEAGVTLEEIGAALGGLSKQRVSDIVREVRTSRSY